MVTNSALRKIAFIAMPFGIKNTGIKPADGPERVDYDALWELAIKPALLRLNYMPLRADEQSGSVIIKDMLVALVHADLVLADISVANGNVYYEAGIRHAARKTGCILIQSNWARPLFDLEQISQIRYPLMSMTPGTMEYRDIESLLVDKIPQFTDSTGPVYELVRHVDSPEAARSELRERTDVLYEFDTKLSAARLDAANGEKEPLRSMLTDVTLKQLPGFALKELVDVVRDNLNWATLVSVIDSLSDSSRYDAHFQEQKALGLCMGGKMSDGVAILEEVIDRDGKSCLRLGNLGGMYRRLASIESTRNRTRYVNSAIQAFRDGMSLDLNDYYCAHKLLIMLVERNRANDDVEAAKVSLLLEAACKRAVNLDSQDEWLFPTLLIHAYCQKDVSLARDYADRVIGQSWPNWQLMGLLSDLLCLLGLKIDEDLNKKLEDMPPGEVDTPLLEICREIQQILPITQETLMSRIFPIMDKSEHTHQKQGTVDARLAIDGERIVSFTNSGEETIVYASEGDIVVVNNTDAKEQYVVEGEIFEKRYETLVPLTAEFQRYEALGQSLAIPITHELTTMLGVGSTFFINPAWESEQYAEEGDYFVSPLPEKKEIYRVGKPEFESTYVTAGE